MAIPSFPSNFFKRIFASGGNYKIIPETDAGTGRASQDLGFPNETQLPLSQGGVAPNRTDFNGLFYMLSAFAFWQQSGGQAIYNTTLDYTVPNIVYHNGKLWWCLANNGPSVTGAGARIPGSSEAYWKEFFSYMADNSGYSFGSETPVGTVITFYGVNAPEGYLACDGAAFSSTTYPKLYALLGSSITPDLRGYFIRGYDTRNSIDPDGANRAIGSAQGDAIRNITGEFTALLQSTEDVYASGAMNIKSIANVSEHASRSNNLETPTYELDASRVVPTAAENRPINKALLYCIKHD